jgi:hypothetical protein
MQIQDGKDQPDTDELWHAKRQCENKDSKQILSHHVSSWKALGLVIITIGYSEVLPKRFFG